MRLHLASRSPRRRQLLAEAGIAFELVDVDVDETLDHPLPPIEVARHLAERKARAGAGVVRDGWVLGADTIVALGERVLGKPEDRAHARAMLTDLAGSTHRVVTGVCFVEAAGDRVVIDADVTEVVMRPMTADEIAAYVATGESDDKAGSYAIQEKGDAFVERIDGSYSNVVGLPMELVTRILRELGGPVPGGAA